MLEDIEEKYPFLTILPLMVQKDSFINHKSSDICLSLFLKEKDPKLALIVGVDVFIDAEFLMQWLDKDQSRRIVFFEKRPEILQEFLCQEKAFLLHPHVQIRFLGEAADLLEPLIEEIAHYPADQLQILLSEAYQELVDQENLKVELLRKASLITSWFHETAWYHHLCDNLFPNFNELSRAFDADSWQKAFANKPAIICGAGPSLEAQVHTLKKLQDKMFILAGGSTLSALAGFGVTPHLGFALDPNPEEYERLHQAYGSSYPLLFGARLEKRVLKAWQGPIGYMKTSSGGFLEQQLQHLLGLNEEPLLKGLSEEALSVTTMALSAAVSLGCNPIYLVGIDLAFCGNKRYASGVIEEKDNHSTFEQKTTCISEKVFCLNRDNQQVQTSIKWIMEKDAIEAFAKNHPEISFFDCIEGGLGFACLPRQSLGKLVDLPNIYPSDFVKQALSGTKACCDNPEKLVEFFKQLKASLQATLEAVETMLFLCSSNKHTDQYDPEKSGIGTLCLLDLEQQPCYKWLLQPLDPYTKALFKSPFEKWQHFKDLIALYLEKF